MSRVFVIHDDGKRDLSDLKRFGEPVTIFTRDLYPDDVDDQISNARAHAITALAGFNPRGDFLCLLGSPLYIALCCLVLGSRQAGSVQVLRFDRREQAYYAVQLKV
jgi:hypothetical protein